MKAKFLIYIIILATGTLLLTLGINDNPLDVYFGTTLVILAMLNIIIDLLRRGKIK